jgi:hypothetical protein
VDLWLWCTVVVHVVVGNQWYGVVRYDGVYHGRVFVIIFCWCNCYD